MADDAYQAMGSAKQQQIDSNAAQVAAKPEQLHSMAKAVSHLNKQTERGVHAPTWDIQK